MGLRTSHDETREIQRPHQGAGHAWHADREAARSSHSQTIGQDGRDEEDGHEWAQEGTVLMPNHYYTPFSKQRITGKKLSDHPAGGTMAMPEKPAFPKASAGGKTQPRNRTGGTPKCNIYPKSDGL